MKFESILRYSHLGIVYSFVEMEGNFHENTSFNFQVVGNFDNIELSSALKELIKIRNTNPLDNKEVNYFSNVSKTVDTLDIHYLGGSGTISIIVNKARILFCGEANCLNDFAKKLGDFKE